MTDIPPRCPFCASIIKAETSFWSRLGLKPRKAVCSTCTRDFDHRDAQTMGAQYWNWAELFRQQLIDALQSVPILSEPAVHRALGEPLKDDIRMVSSLEELVRTCLRYHRTALIEMARGREATLEVVHLRNQVTAATEAVAILGTSSAESGARQWEQIVARAGLAHFVLFTYSGADGAEPRVKRALHAQHAPKITTDPHAVAALHNQHAPAPVRHN